MNKILFGLVVLFLVSACADRKGLETGQKLFKHYCTTCHAVNKKTKFFQDIKYSSLSRRASLTLRRVIMDDSLHGKKKVEALNELSQKEADKVVKYLFDSKVNFENYGEITFEQ
ncbi:MAG: c-type cytochrome [Gammaproteobacteria bacterium]|nr:c-type cytochrome [Gammaproteobacteria bacterium]